MRVKEMTYEFNRNKGNYQSKRVSVTVEILEGEQFADAFIKAEAAVCKALGMDKFGNPVKEG